MTPTQRSCGPPHIRHQVTVRRGAENWIHARAELFQLRSELARKAGSRTRRELARLARRIGGCSRSRGGATVRGAG